MNKTITYNEAKGFVGYAEFYFILGKTIHWHRKCLCETILRENGNLRNELIITPEHIILRIYNSL
jgi:hypothetical protein